MEQTAKAVMEIYLDIDGRIDNLTRATGFACPPGCGACCEKQSVEATVLECLPAAAVILARGDGEKIRELIIEREKLDDRTCLFYRPDPEIPGNGRCSLYEPRPLICRLFGFSARRNRFDNKEFVYCRKQPPFDDAARINVETYLKSGLNVPIFQDEFMKVNSIDPGKGVMLKPINTALREAIEVMFWNYSFRSDISSD